MPNSQKIEKQIAVNSEVNNNAQNIEVMHQYFIKQAPDKFAAVRNNFNDDVLLFKPVMSKEYFALLSKYLKNKIDDLSINDYKTYCENTYVQHDFFKKSFRQFFYSINYLSYLNYISNTSDICVIYGEVDKIASCKDGFVFTKTLLSQESHHF